jgi:NDP-sugar pyrophosphorylase family protein
MADIVAPAIHGAESDAHPARPEATGPIGDEIAGVVLAAGAGTRLRPLTQELPKALCPVANVALVDWALESVEAVTPDVAVNTHHGADQFHDHFASRTSGSSRGVRISHEEPEALGTAGALAKLAAWIDGRPALTVNADMWHRGDLLEFVRRWDNESPAILTTTPGPFGARSSVVASITPPAEVGGLRPVPSGLWETLWAGLVERGRLQTLHTDSFAVDCGRPADYLRANLIASGGDSVVAEDAHMDGTVEKSVVWSGARVGHSEVLRCAIRTPKSTVLVR